MNSSENFSISDYPLDYENENDEGVEKVIQFWIEGILTPLVGLLGVLGKRFSIALKKEAIESRAALFMSMK